MRYAEQRPNKGHGRGDGNKPYASDSTVLAFGAFSQRKGSVENLANHRLSFR